MRIKVENFRLEVSDEELSYILLALEMYLKYKVRNFWTHDQTKDWEKEESISLHMYREISHNLGKPYEYEDLIREIGYIFENFNKENENE